MRPRSLEQVARAGLCSGCGLCADGSSTEIAWDAKTEFLRPRGAGALARDTTALADCPGINVAHDAGETEGAIDPIWGPVVAARVGAATDEDVRYRGSSGGVLTALLIHLLRSGQITGVLQIGTDSQDPMLSTPRIGRTPEEIVACAGSRYAPSPTLRGIAQCGEPGDRLAIVGKPCDIVGFRSLARRSPQLRERFVVAFAFFCAGVPSQQASRELVRKMGGAPDDVVAFRYRGHGWPGTAAARLADGREVQMSYNDSWGGVLSRHVQFRCKICPDGSGEFADVVCADAWYGVDGYPDFAERDGRSAILSRTALGERIVTEALAAGVLSAEPLALREIDKMQPFQVKRKVTVFSRIAALHFLGRRTPRYRRMGLLRAAARASIALQLRSFVGTAVRVIFP